MPIRLIVGLGNPGIAYEQTRHNVGVWTLKQIVKEYQVILSSRKNWHGFHGQFQLNDIPYHLFMPTTFMNESGRGVNALIRYYKIPLSDVLIIHDDLDLSPGVIRLKSGGGSGGHNGIKSIVSLCGDNNFWRLRVGIGHPGMKALVSHYVLSRPSLTEFSNIERALHTMNVVLPLLLKGDYELAMQTLHRSEKS